MIDPLKISLLISEDVDEYDEYDEISDEPDEFGDTQQIWAEDIGGDIIEVHQREDGAYFVLINDEQIGELNHQRLKELKEKIIRKHPECTKYFSQTASTKISQKLSLNNSVYNAIISLALGRPPQWYLYEDFDPYEDLDDSEEFDGDSAELIWSHELYSIKIELYKDIYGWKFILINDVNLLNLKLDEIKELKEAFIKKYPQLQKFLKHNPNYLERQDLEHKLFGIIISMSSKDWIFDSRNSETIQLEDFDPYEDLDDSEEFKEDEFIGSENIEDQYGNKCQIILFYNKEKDQYSVNIGEKELTELNYTELKLVTELIELKHPRLISKIMNSKLFMTYKNSKYLTVNGRPTIAAQQAKLNELRYLIFEAAILICDPAAQAYLDRI